jgi:hypothetical protein
VAAGREFVEAYVVYIHYVEELIRSGGETDSRSLPLKPTSLPATCADAFLERCHQSDRLLMLLEQIGEGFIDEVLEADTSASGDGDNRLPVSSST